jgi:hypothetical protein
MPLAVVRRCGGTPLVVRPCGGEARGAMPVLSCGGAMAVRWLTDVRYALGENQGKHTAAPAACSRFTPEDAAKARRHAQMST